MHLYTYFKIPYPALQLNKYALLNFVKEWLCFGRFVPLLNADLAKKS